MSVFDKLYDDKIYPKDWIMGSDDKYANAKNRAKQYYEIMEKELSPKGLKILNKLLENHYQMSEKENMHFFISGLKLGMSMDFNSLQ